MPKTGVARNSAPTTSAPADSAWEGPAAPAVVPPTEISDSDKAKVAELMKQLGLE